MTKLSTSKRPRIKTIVLLSSLLVWNLVQAVDAFPIVSHPSSKEHSTAIPYHLGRMPSLLRKTIPSSSHKRISAFARIPNPPTVTTRTTTTLRGGAELLPAVLGVLTTNPSPWKACGTYLAMNAVGFAISLITGSHLHLDLIGTGAFAVGALPGLSSTVPHVKYSSMAICLWSVKLASFLFYRASRVGHDMRLEETLESVSGTFLFWAVSVVWNICSSMPYLVGLWNQNHANASNVTSAGGWSRPLGGLVFSIGFLIETIADGQKWFFKLAHPGKFCGIGLWSISQHPNFLGNLLLWSGIYILNIPGALIGGGGWCGSCFRLLAGLVSPVFLWNLFNGQAQGTFMNSVQLAATKYGNDPAYKAYLRDVPAILPKFW